VLSTPYHEDDPYPLQPKFELNLKPIVGPPLNPNFKPKIGLIKEKTKEQLA
jgi:hypothetical protein